MNALQLFKCLSDDTRLKSVLLIHQFQEACVCELMEALLMDQPKVSRNLAALRKCNILLDERRGKWVYYKMHPQLPAWAKNVIEQTAVGNCDELSDVTKRFQACQIQNSRCC
ncbi:metalloregulator ArsR/SmtB family transcription factor [Aestuariibacter sp. A3R04]|uniref:metalloregulator ArsR/SmtB family transcription factor n=1 Tax=Aestuariibacter sp. A3R04 TaxID=2841571 RepID=UPI001C091F21|nr:metalloregulator ArsR/SmtB family transcription factor [Aestuariibacter sp. A3R04]MBU3023342.1 metalloregulator ArsR/SmtB family transcription factor [Aestuariibacter sp. A3R04]